MKRNHLLSAAVGALIATATAGGIAWAASRTQAACASVFC